MTKHKTKQKLIVAFVLGLCLSFGGTALASGGVIGVREQVVIALSGYLQKHPDAAIAHKLALWLVPDKKEMENLGVLVDTRPVTSFNKICYKDSDGARCVAVGWEEMTVSATTNTTAEANRLSVPYFIDYAEIEVNGVVSSSFALSMGTTTAGFVNTPATTTEASPGNGTAKSGVPDGLIQSTYFVTSSNAGTPGYPTYLVAASSTQRVEMQPEYRFLVSTTSSVRQVGVGVNGIGFSSVPVATSTFVTVYARNIISISSSTIYLPYCDSAGVQCEAVTSSNRGWTARARWRYHYAIDL